MGWGGGVVRVLGGKGQGPLLITILLLPPITCDVQDFLKTNRGMRFARIVASYHVYLRHRVLVLSESSKVAPKFISGMLAFLTSNNIHINHC